jgi:hypothetical protein
VLLLDDQASHQPGRPSLAPELPGLADVCLEVVPGAVAQLGDGADDEAVLLLRVRLALVGAVVDLQQAHQQQQQRQQQQ